MKSLLRIGFLVLLLTTALFGNAFTEPLEKVLALIESDIAKIIAGILFAICGFVLASGQFDKGKSLAWGLIIGISLVYGAKAITALIWG